MIDVDLSPLTRRPWQREKDGDLTADDLLRLEPVREFFVEALGS